MLQTETDLRGETIFIFNTASIYLTGLGGNQVDIYAVVSLNVRNLGLVLTGIFVRISCTRLPNCMFVRQPVFL